MLSIQLANKMGTKQTIMSRIPIKSYMTAIRESRDQLVIIDCNKSVWMLKVAERIGLVNLAGVSKSCFDKRTLTERVWPQEESI